MTERLPPHDEAAERAVLGAALQEGSAVLEGLAELSAEDFYPSAHQRIFGAMQALATDGPVDAVLVKDRLSIDGDLERVGGERYLAELVATVPSAASAPYYADIVRRYAAQRNAIHSCTSIQAAIYGGAAPEWAAEQLATAAEEVGTTRASIDAHVDEALDSMWADMATGSYWTQARGLSWPVDSLTERLTLRRGELTIVGASTSHGKSVLCAATALRAALDEEAAVLFVSTEALEREVLVRMLCMESAVKSCMLRENALNGDDFERLTKAMNSIKNAPGGLHILDLLKSPELSVATIAAHARRIKKAGALDLVVVDYIQQLHAEGETRELAVGSISAGLKRLALQLEVPVIAAAQLNRGASGSGRPMLQHLRESGRLEQDANNVVLLHYPFRDDPKEPADTIQAYVDKVRDGEIGSCTLGFNPSCYALFNRGNFRHVAGDSSGATAW